MRYMISEITEKLTLLTEFNYNEKKSIQSDIKDSSGCHGDGDSLTTHWRHPVDRCLNATS